MPPTGSAWLPCFLDVSMLDARGVIVHSSTTPDERLDRRSGAEVAADLGGRFLISYLRERDVKRLDDVGMAELQGVSRPIYTTPSPLASADLVATLGLPLPTLPRTFAIILDPAQIPAIIGPRRVLYGDTVEYLLPEGYPKAALVLKWPRPIA